VTRESLRDLVIRSIIAAAMPFAPHALVREKTEARAARLENAGDLVNHNIKIGDVLKNLLMTRSKLPVTKGVRSPSIRK